MNPIFANALTVWYHTIIAPPGQTLWAGSLWSNMYAWVICGFIAILWGRRKVIKWDKARKKREEERHEELKAHINQKHEELKAHITQVHKRKK